MGTENVASKKYTAARCSFMACMMSSSRRSGVASGSAASSSVISAETLSSLPANLLGARPSVAACSGSRGSMNAPYSRSMILLSTSAPTASPSSGQPSPVQMPGGSPCSATAER